MLDHITFAVADVARSKTFYDMALAPIGIGPIVSVFPEQTGGEGYLATGRKAGFTSGSAAASR
jgi:catechol 2,3-dioxygenase-like lactoylglutathione lyase family enzyme